jgi:predicted DNA binding protein
MGTIVEAEIPTDQFALRDAFDRLEAPEFEILRLVEHGEDRVMPFLWATARDLEAFPEVLYDDPSTDNVEVVAELEEEYLFRMEWTAHIRVVLFVLLEEEATVMNARAADDVWKLRILFPEHESVSATDDFCEEYDIDLTFERIYELSDSLRRGRYGLTEAQYDSIVTAFQRGYYDVPRETELADIAADYDVSHQALSERLRRGHRSLIETTLAPRPEPADE